MPFISLKGVKALVMVTGPGLAGKHSAQPDGHCLGHEVPALPGHRAQVISPLAYTTPDTARLHESKVCVWLGMHLVEVMCISKQSARQSNARRGAVSRTPCRDERQLTMAELTSRLDDILPLPCSDLKGANVLIKTGKAAAKDPRGFVCKLADFGLARVLGSNRTHVSTSTHGARPNRAEA